MDEIGSDRLILSGRKIISGKKTKTKSSTLQPRTTSIVRKIPQTGNNPKDDTL